MAQNKDREHTEFLAIAAIFSRFLDCVGDVAQWEILEELMALRADFAIHRAVEGFGMDWEKALELLRNFNSDLPQRERDERDILVAAIDNLVDFAVAEEFQMADDLPDEIDVDDPDCVEDCEEVCYRYNFVYANGENRDIEFALGVAAVWLGIGYRTEVMFMTQGDERVRSLHLALEGTSYPKSEFPSALIPPIDHGCRCFLITEDFRLSGVRNFAGVENRVDFMDIVNPVFAESVATGGRIFSEAHPYFTIDKRHLKRLRGIAERIKGTYYGN